MAVEGPRKQRQLPSLQACIDRKETPPVNFRRTVNMEQTLRAAPTMPS